MANCHINTLELSAFRNFSYTVFKFDSNLNIVLGNNGRGKTNTLEAISLLSTGISFKANLLSECILLHAQAAHISCCVTVENEAHELGLSILSSEVSSNMRATTRFKKNGVFKRRNEIAGIIKSILFRPEDMEIITAGPRSKRDYLDSVPDQVSMQYVHALHEYEQALKHRNKLILQLREGGVSRSEFAFWDTLLLKHGEVISRERSRFIHYLNSYVDFPITGKLHYDHSLMTEERLHKYAVAEVAAGKTLIGPHRDSIHILLNFGNQEMLDVERFGSRGQQRLAVLWLKIAALQFIENETAITPILLLDDVFSELDESNREILFSVFAKRQVVITSAEEESVLPNKIQQGRIINL